MELGNLLLHATNTSITSICVHTQIPWHALSVLLHTSSIHGRKEVLGIYLSAFIHLYVTIYFACYEIPIKTIGFTKVNSFILTLNETLL